MRSASLKQGKKRGRDIATRAAAGVVEAAAARTSCVGLKLPAIKRPRRLQLAAEALEKQQMQATPALVTGIPQWQHYDAVCAHVGAPLLAGDSTPQPSAYTSAASCTRLGRRCIATACLERKRSGTMATPKRRVRALPAGWGPALGLHDPELRDKLCAWTLEH